MGRLADLVREVNGGAAPGDAIEPSTVHFLRALDLVSSPGRGRGATWTTTQLREIRLVRALQRKGFTLRSIRERLAGEREETLAPAPSPAPPGAALSRALPRFQPQPLESIPLGAGVEIVVRRPLSSKEEWALRHLLEEAERLFRP